MDDRSSDDKLLRAIKHYQDSVTRHTESGNDAKVHVLEVNFNKTTEIYSCAKFVELTYISSGMFY